MIGKPILNQLTAYKQGMQIKDVQEKYQLEKIVKLASNENPYGYSDQVKRALEQMDFDLEIYPDGYAYDLRVALSEKLNVHLDSLVFGAGSDEIITFICRAFLTPGANTVMATPTFPQYRHHALIEGAQLKEIPTLANGKHDLNRMSEAIDENTKVVWLCSPDNPTGTLISQDEFVTFMEKTPKDVIVVLDEAYYEFVDEANRLSLNETVERYPNVIVLRTFSKIYGLAGFRVGYAVSNIEISDKLNVVRGPFNTTSIGQRLAKIALADDTFIENTKKQNNEVREMFQQFLDSIGWEYYDSHTNFLLVKTPIDADVVAEYLLKNGYIIRSGTFLGYLNTIRITLGTKADMEQLQQVFVTLQKEMEDGLL